MRVTFWGVRGSIPTPGPDTVRYGGNTTCLEVRTNNGDLIILDAGSGLRPLGLVLAAHMPVTCAVFVTHTHWDHIQGLPFFVPLFVPGNRIALYGARDPVSFQTVRDALAVQMEYRYFPVRAMELKSSIETLALAEGEAVAIGAATITSITMNHPVLTLGYKIQADDATLFFTGDHEPYQNIYDPAEDDYLDYQKWIDEREAALTAFLRGVDLLIADAQYTEAEYPQRRGWGHSTHERCLDLARHAHVPRLILTHHEPTRSDTALDVIATDLQAGLGPGDPEVVLAREGLGVEV